MAIKSISEIKQKFAPLARPMANDFGDLIDTFEGRYQSLEGGFKGVTLGDMLPAPIGNTIYVAMEPGAYENLKFKNGSPAPGLNVTTVDMSHGSVFLKYNFTDDSWSKDVKVGQDNPDAIFSYAAAGKNKFNKEVVKPATVLRDGYEQTDFAGWVTSFPMPVQPSKDYYLSNVGARAFFDSALNQIAGSYASYFPGGDAAISSPASAAYIKICTSDALLDSCQMEEGFFKTDYEQFFKLYDKKKSSEEVVFFKTHLWTFGRKMLTIGDSVTVRDWYQPVLKSILGLESYSINAVAGRRIGQFVNLPDDSGQIPPAILNAHDIILINGYINNWDQNTPMGSITDSTAMASFYGEAKKTFEYLITNAPTKIIVYCSPFQFGVYGTGEFGTTNAAGLTQKNYNDAIELVCKKYGVPFIDLSSISGVCALNKNSFYGAPDYYHPTQTAGNQRMAQVISAEIKKLR